MSNPAQPNGIRYAFWLLLTLLLVLGHLLLFGPVTALVALYGWRIKFTRKRLLLWSCLSVLFLSWYLNQFAYSLFLWIVSLPLFPLALVSQKAIVMLSYSTQPTSLEDALNSRSPEQGLRAAAAHLNPSYGQAAPQPNQLRLGKLLNGRLADSSRDFRLDNGCVLVNADAFKTHMAVFGQSGAGKTNLLSLLAYEWLRSTDHALWVIDGKGEQTRVGDQIYSLGETIRAYAHHLRGVTAPVFRLGAGVGGAIYDPFRGDADSIYDRLVVLNNIATLEGDSDYYGQIGRVLLGSLCHVPEGPPRSFEETFRRCQRDYLDHAHKYHSDPSVGQLEREMLRSLRDEDYRGLQIRLAALARVFARQMGSGGFALEEVNAATFEISAAGRPDSARRMANLLIEDFRNMMSDPSRLRGGGLIIFDEYGQFGSENIESILNLGRSKGIGVVLATQDLSTIKNKDFWRSILAGCQTRILMRSDHPEEVVETAGTVYRPEVGYQMEGGLPTGVATIREQHQFQINPNDVARLAIGECFIIQNRRVGKTHIQRVPQVPPVAPQAERVRSLDRKVVLDNESKGATVTAGSQATGLAPQPLSGE